MAGGPGANPSRICAACSPRIHCIARRLVAIATCFERVWYGNATASAADYEAALAELESLP